MRIFVALAPVLAWAGGADRVLERSLLSLGLLLALRLWDDLASVEEDRLRAPERVLCRVDHTAPRWTVALLLLACAPFVDTLALAGLVAAGLLYYASRGDGLLRAHLLLLKYPALVFILRGEDLGWPVLVAVFGAVGLYELAHDPRRRRAALAPLFLFLDAAALTAGVLSMWSTP
jgi:hypothetical protein